jgi:hypothetical protein
LLVGGGIATGVLIYNVVSDSKPQNEGNQI